MQWARVASVSLRCKTAKLRTKERLSSYINIYTSVYMYVDVYMCVYMSSWLELFVFRSKVARKSNNLRYDNNALQMQIMLWPRYLVCVCVCVCVGLIVLFVCQK